MKYNRWLLGFSGLLACWLMACSGYEGWALEGKCSLPRFSSVLLLSGEGEVVDSVAIRDGRFSLELPEKADEARAATARLLNADDADDYLDMPVMIERGKVSLSIGEYIRIGGTPLNEALQEFLDGLQACKDSCLRQTGLEEEEIARIFSDFYLRQIAAHRHDALGAYIFRSYGTHLSKEDFRKAKDLLNTKYLNNKEEK